MESKWLEDFLSLAKTRHFSRAAIDRNTTQPTLSRRIMALEQWLGVDLLDRSVHPAALTPAGGVFRRLAPDLLNKIYAARALMGAQAGVESMESIQLAVSQSLMNTFLPDCLAQLRAAHGPKVSCIQLVNATDSLQRLLDGHCDALLTYHYPMLAMPVDPSRYRHVTVGRERLLPMSAPNEDRMARYRLHCDTVESLPYLAYAACAFLGSAVDSILLNAPHVPRLRRCFETQVEDALKAMIVAGHGIGWLPERYAATDLAAGRLVVAGDDVWSAEVEVRLYCPVDSVKPGARSLIEAVGLSGDTFIRSSPVL